MMDLLMKINNSKEPRERLLSYTDAMFLWMLLYYVYGQKSIDSFLKMEKYIDSGKHRSFLKKMIGYGM